jgi:hypothetical protein
MCGRMTNLENGNRGPRTYATFFEMNFRVRIDDILLAAVAGMLAWLIVVFLRTAFG